jgi:hypothetical protein
MDLTKYLYGLLVEYGRTVDKSSRSWRRLDVFEAEETAELIASHFQPLIAEEAVGALTESQVDAIEHWSDAVAIVLETLGPAYVVKEEKKITGPSPDEDYFHGGVGW